MSQLQGATVLLTGATGFIGSHLRRRLARAAPRKLVMTTREARAQEHPFEQWVTSSLDRLTPQTWRDAEVDEVDVVLHLGSYTPKSGRHADDVTEVFRDNLEGTRALLHSLPNVPKKLVFSSTLDVYRLPVLDGAVLSEDSVIAPPSLYGASKLFCEHLIAAYARANGCPYTVLRYGHIYGPGEEAYAKLIPVVIRSLLEGENPVVYGDGSVLRDFFYVDDAVEATIRAADSPSAIAGPINIVAGASRPVREIVDLLRSFQQDAPPVKYLVDRPGGHSLRFSADRMNSDLGMWPRVPLEEGLKREFLAFSRAGL